MNRATAGDIALAVHELCNAGSDTSHFNSFGTRPVVKLLGKIKRVF